MPNLVRFRLLAAAVPVALAAVACGSVTEGVDLPADDTTTTTAGATTEAPEANPSAQGGDDTVDVGDTVSVHYVGTLDSGEQFDSSRDRGEPLSFAVGAGQMIVGFDAAVQGMKLGEVKTVRLAPADAYGEKDPAATIEVGLADVPEGTAVGDALFAQTGQQFVVLEINDDVVVLDANHPLAGEHLTFEIEIVSIGG